MDLDQSDLKILSTLQAKPDIAIADLAQEVGLSTTPCWRRLKKLERNGVIAGRAILLNAKALGLTVNVFANLRLRQHDEETLRAFEAEVRRHQGIVECFSVSGDSDYLLRVVIESIEAYERFLKSVLLHLPGVASINSCFTLGCVKNTTALPIPSPA